MQTAPDREIGINWTPLTGKRFSNVSNIMIYYFISGGVTPTSSDTGHPLTAKVGLSIDEFDGDETIYFRASADGAKIVITG